ncbi:hypothetical protein BaRGS_00001252 [Batillaria attramentaria]|uniref:Anion exchange protein n=1 Tax=Batillaria attramentaria TaxID=370345 RepID=A0ABD0M6N4_9CAEN
MDPPVDSSQPIRDLGVRRDVNPEEIDTNADSHRADLIHVRMPTRPRRPNKRHSSKRGSDRVTSDSVSPASMTPREHIQLLLGDVGEEGEAPKIFCQMDVLHKLADVFQWRETARWVKYEEDVEEGGERWSKPHVASLSLHSLFELRSGLTNGACVLDMEASNISQVADLLLDRLINGLLLEEDLRGEFRTALIAPHTFQHTKRGRRQSTTPDLEGMGRRLSIKRSFSLSKRDSNVALGRNPSSHPNMEHLNGDLTESPSSAKLNQQFMRKIPDGAEAANILIGELEGLKYQVCAFIRLQDAKNIGDITEVPLPTRFMFVLMGPKGCLNKIHEVGRAMSTIMVDEVFREVAFKAKGRADILAGVDEFLDQVTALPPGEWDPKIRIEPPQKVPPQAPRKAPLLFGGLINDIKRKIPWYPSDFKDALHIQCIASIIFLYLATLTPNVTFGGLLGQATDQYMGTMECILTAAIVGVLFALFAGQPLNILGSTGPMLVLEMILYQFCKSMDMDFLPLRAWIGIWTTFFLMLIVAFDLSALVRYITRFTEESFASLIAIIFIAEAFKKLFGILKIAPVNTNPNAVLDYNCTCYPPNTTFDYNVTFDSNLTMSMNHDDVTTVMTTTAMDDVTGNYSYNMTTTPIDWESLSKKECTALKGLLVGTGCDTPEYAPDVFFFSVILFFSTYIIASTLSGAKTSTFFPTFVRQTFSDFAVLISILVCVGSDALIGVNTPKLTVPEQFKPTRDDRGWFVNPWSDKNPWWAIVGASVPALLAVILIFMDQQITAVIVNRKENLLKKGNGYHLDLLVVAICILICSMLGLPWYVAATVSALAHIMSLKKESECTAPGERPTFLGCREQRVTALMVGLLSGLSVLFTPILKYIPMPVLYGVFLYMGVAALKGMQFVDRFMLIFKPAKYQPDLIYLRHVPIKRVHLFTFIQIICLACLWVIKSIKSVSIVFPIMVLGTCFIRKAMDKIFTQRELKWLDDLMPDSAKKAKEDAQKLKEADKGDAKERENLLGEQYDRVIDMKIQHEKLGEGKFNQRVTRRPSVDTGMNISEEMSRTAIWMQLRNNANKPGDADDGQRQRKRRGDNKNGVGGDKSAAFYLVDDDDHHHSAKA